MVGNQGKKMFCSNDKWQNITYWFMLFRVNTVSAHKVSCRLLVNHKSHIAASYHTQGGYANLTLPVTVRTPTEQKRTLPIKSHTCRNGGHRGSCAISSFFSHFRTNDFLSMLYIVCRFVTSPSPARLIFSEWYPWHRRWHFHCTSKQDCIRTGLSVSRLWKRVPVACVVDILISWEY